MDLETKCSPGREILGGPEGGKTKEVHKQARKKSTQRRFIHIDPRGRQTAEMLTRPPF